MSSRAEIASLALIALEQSPVSSLDANTDNARIMKRILPQALDALLESHPWSFAFRTKYLTRMAAPVGSAYAYAFPLPPDCVTVLEVRPSENYATGNNPQGGSMILTDEKVVVLDYTTNNLSVNDMSASFRDAWIDRSAAMAAPKILGSDTDTTQKWATAEKSLAAARQHAADTSGRPAPKTPDRFLKARR